MALKKTKFIKGIILAPDAIGLDAVEGELKVDSADGKIKATLKDGANPSASREIVTNSQTQELTNKTVTTPVINGTVSGTAIEADLSVSAAADKLAYAGSIKTYVDNKVASKDEASEIAVNPVVGDAPNNNTVQKVLETHESRLDTVEPKVTTLETGLASEITNRQAADNGKANTALDNLTTTAINLSLIPATNNSINLGFQSNASPATNKIYLNSYIANYRIISSAGLDIASISGTKTTPSGFSAAGISGGNTRLSLQSDNSSSATTSNYVHLETGNNSSTGNSGDVIIRTGTVVSGIRGEVSITSRQVNVNSAKVVNVATPTSANDAANKAYVDAVQSNIIVSQTSFTIANAQSSPADITGLSFSPLLFRSVKIEYSLYRQTDTLGSAAAQVGQLRIVYNTQLGEWLVSDDFAGQNAGVEFSVDNTTGQIKYTSTDLDPDNSNPNYVGALKYSLIKTFGV